MSRPAALILLAWIALQGCYTLKQIHYQSKLLKSSRPVKDVLLDPSVSQQEKDRLRMVEEILRFAKNDEGLNVGSTYSTYIQTGRPVVSYIVEAAKADAFEAKTWWFPFVGTVPYLGFFHEKDRDDEAKDLQAQGFDVAKGSATAFSLLGWFDDPIFSSMLQRDQAALAHLFFHELTHRTAWISGEVEFNESLAEFCAYLATLRYLEKHGNTELKAAYLKRQEEDRLFAQWLSELKGALEKAYTRQDVNREQKLKIKEELFSRYLGSKAPAISVDRWSRIAKQPWNNAVVLSAMKYLPDLARFKKSYDCSHAKKIGDFLDMLEKKYKSLKESWSALDALCHS